MRKYNQYISYLVLSFTLTGFFMSVAHYHSEGLLCVEHSKEQHYTENSQYCPLDVVLAEVPVVNPLTSELLLNPEDRVFNYSSPVIHQPFYRPSSPRAPPFLV